MKVEDSAMGGPTEPTQRPLLVKEEKETSGGSALLDPGKTLETAPCSSLCRRRETEAVQPEQVGGNEREDEMGRDPGPPLSSVGGSPPWSICDPRLSKFPGGGGGGGGSRVASELLINPPACNSSGGGSSGGRSAASARPPASTTSRKRQTGQSKDVCSGPTSGLHH
ncbi:hypothetical protein JRQ81_012102 [Phrynocephalus forsythii]|uniref:Uncharacterized protein n=1 Tax=Phrynocephalus forsythii TaxID=171643 RepID=A0A9Q0X658_9SAUR|nr:hypothetical protein JRQ81_012102 [Phrynocephalus forsythii]